MKILIKGVRNTTHSVAMVNQFNLLALGGIKGINLVHWDAPHPYENINPGFNDRDTEFIKALPNPCGEDVYDAELNMSTQLISNSKTKSKFNFFVTEFGHLKNESISYIQQTFKQHDDLIVPSNWVANIVKRNIYNTGNIQIIPHGVNEKYFFKHQPNSTRELRSALGFNENNFIFLNLGAMTWNKGIDKLLSAFGVINKKHHQTKLILKDSANLYGIKATDTINNLIAKGIISADIAKSITIISQNLNFEQLNNLYNVADCYLAPYRAEGFNIPVLESMFCNTPVIVSKGGSTDDFANTSICTKIDTNFIESEIGFHLEPNEDSLISAMEKILNNQGMVSSDEITEHEIYTKNFTTDKIANSYLMRFIEKKNRC